MQYSVTVLVKTLPLALLNFPSCPAASFKNISGRKKATKQTAMHGELPRLAALVLAFSTFQPPPCTVVSRLYLSVRGREIGADGYRSPRHRHAS